MFLIMNRSPRDPGAVMSWERTHNVAREATGEQASPLLLVLQLSFHTEGLALRVMGSRDLRGPGSCQGSWCGSICSVPSF